MIIGLVLLGRWLEARAKSQAAGAVKALLKLRPTTARVLRDGREADLPIDQVRAGDLVRVRPGSACQPTARSSRVRQPSTSRC